MNTTPQTTFPNQHSKRSYNLIIIGGGATGISAATRAAELEINTLLINSGLPIGGTCVNIGCVPSKILLQMANDYYYSQFPHYDSILGKCACISDADFSKSVAEKNDMVEVLRHTSYVAPLAEMDTVDQLQGSAEFINAHVVEVNDIQYHGDNIIIATGSRPRIPSIEGLKSIDYLTSRVAMELSDLPSSLAVIGAGSTGLELGQMFHHFGTDVTIIEERDEILTGGEREIKNELLSALRDEEIEVKLSTQVVSLTKSVRGVQILLDDNESIEVEKILLTTGVVPNTEGLGLSKAGVEISGSGFINVDQHLNTSTSHIYAGGDVIGKSMLETTAAREGYLIIKNLYELDPKTMNYDQIPHAVFTTPNYASIGLTEREAKERYQQIDSRTIEYSRIPKAVALKESWGKVKMVINSSTRQILGVHMVAVNAAEVINTASFVITHNLTIDDVIDTVHVFPTMAEGIKKVAQAFIRDIRKMACCVE